jgi:hypothetical protein
MAHKSLFIEWKNWALGVFDRERHEVRQAKIVL